MSRRELGPAGLALVGAVSDPLTEAAAAGRAVVIGCSGGPDSLALTAAVAWCLTRAVRTGTAAPGVRVAIIDHQQQPGSAAVAAGAAAQVRSLGLEPAVIPVQVEPTGDGPEAAARAARQQVWELLDPAEIWLGHTRDDQAEQVLLGLARGSGTRSLSGIWPRRGRYLRPLLDLTRQQTLAGCAEFDLEPWQDPHNQDPTYLRSAVRTQLLPVLEQVLGAGVPAALARTADLCREDAQALDGWAATVLEAQPPGPQLAVDALTGLPVAVGTRVLRAWTQAQAGCSPSASQTRALWQLVAQWRGQGPVDLPGCRVHRVAGQLVIGSSKNPAAQG